MFHRTKRLFRHVRIGWKAFREAGHPTYVPHKPEMLADVPGDTIFALKLPEPHSAVRPQFIKGVISIARIEADGSLSYQLEGATAWHPAHLTVHEDDYKRFLVGLLEEDDYKRFLVGLLEEHGYKPLKFEYIAKAVKTLVSKGLWDDLIGPPAFSTKETADARQ